jgi:hypothetical protein
MCVQVGTYERLHLETAKGILSSPDCNVFAAAGFSEEDQAWALELLEYTVLGTDLGTHFGAMDEWRCVQ